MKKKLIAVMLVCVLLSLLCVSAQAAIKLQIGNSKMTVDGVEQAIDEGGTAPVIRNGRTLLPVRAVVEAMGGTVAWDDVSKTVWLRKDNHEIRLTIGRTDASLDGGPAKLDVAPIIENGRTMLPIRFIAESFGYGVTWYEGDKTVTISKKDGTAKLLYQGQGSVRIQTAEGKVIYVDPYAGSGYDLPADLILVTHGHRDHNNLDLIKTRNDGCAVVTHVEALKDGKHQSFDFGFVKVEAVEAGNNKNHDITKCVGYVLTLTDGKTIYLSGDTSTTEQMSKLADRKLDYAFFCCDGKYNMGLEEAAKCAELVGAKHNVPYHMAPGAPNNYDRSIAEQFAAPNRLIVDAGQEISIE